MYSMEFNLDPQCSNCEGELGWPERYNSKEGVKYLCHSCDIKHSTQFVKVESMPTHYLYSIYKYCSRVDSSIKTNGKEPRYTDLKEAIETELENRGENVELPTYTHRIHTDKSFAIKWDEQYPGIFTTGRIPEEIELNNSSTSMENMKWVAEVTPSEADELAEKERVTIEKL